LSRSRSPAGQRLWQVRAKHVVLATGAFERPLVFADNDRPGVMLASGIGTYLRRFGTLAGRRQVLFTSNDSVYPLALELLDGGAEVAAILDSRSEPASVAGPLRERGVDVLTGHAVAATDGDPELIGGHIRRLSSDGPLQHIACDVLGVSGGFNPVLHLFSQSGGHAAFDTIGACFVPRESVQAQEVVGAAAGDFGIALNVEPVWLVPGPGDDWTTHFVDLERDVTVAALQRGMGAGLRSIEHLKRYTTFVCVRESHRTRVARAIGALWTCEGVVHWTCTHASSAAESALQCAGHRVAARQCAHVLDVRPRVVRNVPCRVDGERFHGACSRQRGALAQVQ
jgi:sarcosine oxidase, subunit alpha